MKSKDEIQNEVEREKKAPVFKPSRNLTDIRGEKNGSANDKDRMNRYFFN